MGLGTWGRAGCRRSTATPGGPQRASPGQPRPRLPPGPRDGHPASLVSQPDAWRCTPGREEAGTGRSVRRSHWRNAQHLSPSRPLRKLSKSSTNVKATSCSDGRRKPAALWEASRPSQRLCCPVVNMSWKEQTGTASMRSSAEYSPNIVTCHPPVTVDPGFNTGCQPPAAHATGSQAPRRLMDAGIKRPVPWAGAGGAST